VTRPTTTRAAGRRPTRAARRRPTRAEGRRPGRLALLALVGVLTAVAVGPVADLVSGSSGPGVAAVASAAGASPAPVVPAYAPAGFVDSPQTAAQIDGELTDFAGFGVNRVLQNLVALKPAGTLPLSATTRSMLPLWVARTAAHDAATGDGLAVVGVLNARLDKGVDLELASTRANVVADALQVAGYGVAGIQLDFEPYPTTPGFVTLLGQLRDALGRAAPDVQLSVVAPAVTTTWTPAYLGAVSALVDEVDPTFYDSGIHNIASYEQWVAAGLAAYSAATAPTARIVPVLPSYRSNRWHRPAVENIATATAAVAAARAAGARVDGAGIWWWWGFFYGSGGHYLPAADQAAWQSSTRPLLGF